MTLYATRRSMTSSVSFEWAEYVEDVSAWRLSWLPNRDLTEAQARAGMELAEAYAEASHDSDHTARCATELNLSAAQAIALLTWRADGRPA
ncbi:hypothetical protein [Nocardia pseudobrasiliensis]|uniref:Uncharacterized protein n=1 Tax=Nocardia pseudobrasiliensis TaxID=45979 RepID=A0A370HYM0_9NOCA|nr:hypothetical protein [Nocardia pseudobrasiliensis]RDI63420.1 hypothetical protein DFR76_110117 [Nocardia pseudobrasiliensis]